jgi:ABC-type branched-subunit amino acid transport system substrate-binding protein/predicted negative regulator of RcsB-dependent stress response
MKTTNGAEIALTPHRVSDSSHVDTNLRDLPQDFMINRIIALYDSADRARRALVSVLGILSLIWAGIDPSFLPWESPSVYAETAKSAPASHPALTQAKRLLDAGQPEEATTILRRFLATSPKPDLLDDTYLLLGAALHDTKEYPEALKYLQQLQREFPDSEVSDRGKLMQARVHASMGNVDLALPILVSIRTLSKDDTAKLEALHLSGELYVQKREPVRAIQAWLDEMALAPDDQAEEIHTRISELINGQLDRKSLDRIQELYSRTFPGDLASIRLIELYVARGEDHQASRQIQQFLNRFPTHPYAAKASDLLGTLQVRLKSHQFVLAAVLPLSGKVAPFSNEVLAGIQLAIELTKDRATGLSVGLIVKDYESERSTFLDDLSRLLTDDHPIAVIGPLLSKSLPVMAELAERTKIPLITPTATIPNVRRLGGYVFSTAITYSMQAKRIAAYATGEQGYRRFCILYPETIYGRELARLFAQEIQQHDGEIIAMESYKEGETDFNAQLKRMKAEDLKKYGLSIPVDPTKTTGRQTKLDKKVLYTPGFDAIFIPGRAQEAGLIAAQINFHDMKVPFLGANGWNSPDFARTADQSIDGAIFVDGFFVDSPNPNVQDFVDRYKKRFQTTPTLFAMQGYDAAKLVLEAIRRGATSGEAVRDYLMTQRDLPTMVGPASFGPEGTLNRPLFLIQVKRGRFTQLD